MSEACGDCKFWERMSGAQGGCRRFPPQVTAIVSRTYADHMALDVSDVVGFNSTFPETQADDWCGEFKERTPRALSFG